MKAKRIRTKREILTNKLKILTIQQNYVNIVIDDNS